MQISPAYASKLIRQKNEQIRLLLAQEKVLPGLGYTIDAALVRMKILSDQKMRFAAMKRVQPVTRIGSGYGNKQPEYVYRNYDSADVERAYDAVESELTDIQLALDKANLESTITVEFE